MLANRLGEVWHAGVRAWRFGEACDHDMPSMLAVAHGMGQESAEMDIGRWLAGQGADDVADKVFSGEWRRDPIQDSRGSRPETAEAHTNSAAGTGEKNGGDEGAGGNETDSRRGAHIATGAGSDLATATVSRQPPAPDEPTRPSEETKAEADDIDDLADCQPGNHQPWCRESKLISSAPIKPEAARPAPSSVKSVKCHYCNAQGGRPSCWNCGMDRWP